MKARTDNFLLRFQEPVARVPFTGGPKPLTRNSHAAIAAGTKTVTEVEAEAPDNDPPNQSHCIIPS